MTPFFDRQQKSKPSKQKRERLQKWLLVSIAFVLFIYLGLSFLAPVLMKAGKEAFASHIYRAYQPACHQLAYRSFFLFGEQSYYPRELAGIKGLKSYETVTATTAEDVAFARNFKGNETLGYKIVLCQRDTAIFASILLFLILYAIFGKKMQAIPWWLWIVLAIIPIGLDGFSQLISQMELPFLAWFPTRESTPFLRVLTGTMFGFFSAWFIVPTFRGEDSSLTTQENRSSELLEEETEKVG